MQKEIQTLKKLAHVHECAKKFADAAQAVRVAESELDAAYTTWRHQNRCEGVFIERRSVLWNQMMMGTAEFYRVLTNAKARKRRAEQKLIAAMEA